MKNVEAIMKKDVKVKEHNTSTMLQNDAFKWFVLTMYLGLNVFVVIFFYYKLRNAEKYHYLYMVGGANLMASRAFGAGLNFNMLVILLPMNKTINSWIRTNILMVFPRSPRRAFDHTKGIHIFCAYVIALYSLVHTILHLVNAFLFHDNFNSIYPDLNPFQTQEGTTVGTFLLSVPGWTGLVLLLILALVFLTSFKGVRRNNYELFLYCHQSALVFLLMACIHGLGMVTKYQNNLHEHPMKCHNITHYNGPEFHPQCKAPPQFTFKGAATWKWLLAPLLLHLLERIFRWVRAWKQCTLVKMAVHDGSVIELLMFKTSFDGRAGQYVRVNCPEIDMFQWHAFTLSKVPTGPTFEERTFSVHIKAAGDWTKELLAIATRRINGDKQKGNVTRVGESCLIIMTKEIALPVIRIDGPYGSPNQDGFTMPVNVSIAAGIGITPYACMLNALKYYNPNNAIQARPLKKMYLIWACRGLTDFNWLVKLMFDVDRRLKAHGHPDFLECILHVTQGYKSEIKIKDMSDFGAAGENDIGEWLKKSLRSGRPKFKQMLADIGLLYNRMEIGVFFCGPPILGTLLEEECSTLKVQGNLFMFHKESF